MPRTTPIPPLDALVFAVGVDAAFPGRPALLGQDPADPAVRRSTGGRVYLALPPGPRTALAELATDAGSQRGTSRRERRALSALSASLWSQTGIAPSVCALALTALAANRLDLAGQLSGPDRVAAQVAGEELVVAALETLEVELAATAASR